MSRGQRDTAFVLRAAPGSAKRSEEPAAGESEAWRVEPERSRIRQGDRSVHVEPRSMEVLEYLARMAGRVVSKGELLEAIWSESFVGEEVLTHAIYELRRALGDDARDPAFIETIHKRGYRLRATVERRRAERPGAPTGGRWRAVAALAAGAVVLWIAWLARPLPRAEHPDGTALLVEFGSPGGSAVAPDQINLFEAKMSAVESFRVVLPQENRRPPVARAGDFGLEIEIPPARPGRHVLAHFRSLDSRLEPMAKEAVYGPAPEIQTRAAETVAEQSQLLGRILAHPLSHDRHIEPWFDLRRHDWAAVLAFLEGAQRSLRFQIGGGELFAQAERLDPGFLAPKIWSLSRFVRAPREERDARVRLLVEEFGSSPYSFESHVALWGAAVLRQDWAVAKREITAALGRAKDNGPLLINLAVTRALEGHVEDAFAILHRLVEEEWPYPALYPQAAEYALRRGDFETAQAILKRACRLPIRPVDTLALLEALAILDGDREEASGYRSALEASLGESPPAEAQLFASAGYLAIIDRARTLGRDEVATELGERFRHLAGNTG